MMRLHKTFWREHRTATIVGVFVLCLLIAIGIYSYISVRMWESKHDQLQTKVETVTALTEAILYDKTVSLDDRWQRVEKLSGETLDGLCATGGLYSWQQSLSESLRRWQEDCTKFEARFKGVKTATQALEVYHAEEKQLVDVLLDLKITKKSLEEGDFQQLAKTVGEVKEKASDLMISTEAGKAVQEVALKKLEALEKGWTALIKAHKAQDSTVYEANLTKLEKAYSEVEAIGTQSTIEYEALIGTLEAAVH